MQSSGNINSAINSNREMYKMMTSPQMSSNKKYVSNTMNYTPTQYYNDEVAIKKKKKKQATKKIIIATTSLIGFGITATALFSGRKSIKKFLNKFEFGKRLDCGLVNFTSIKDDAWQIVQEKCANIPGLKWIDKVGNWYTETYQKWSHNKGMARKFNAQIIEMKELPKNSALKEYIDIDAKKLPDSFDEYHKKINEGQSKTLAEIKKTNQRISQNLIDKENFKKNPIDELKNLFKKLTTSKVADDKFEDVYKKNMYIISTDKLDNAIKTKKDKLAELKRTGHATKQELSKHKDELRELKEARKKITSFNTNSHNIADKLRDINVGNAPTDLITQGIPVAGLIGAIAMADSKEERISKTTDLGIPIIAALATAVWSTANYIVGLPMWGLSFAASYLGKITAKTAVNIIEDNNKNKKENINLKA